MEFGLIGKRLSHSFSQKYFMDKFAAENIPAIYHNFELPSIDVLPDLLAQHPDLHGFNVTIPYKVEIIPLLDAISPEAEEVGAVNVVKVVDGALIGYNTDVDGFLDTLASFYLEGPGGKALVLGTGGASKAVKHVLENHFEFDAVHFVSRTPAVGQLSYDELRLRGLQEYRLIVNTTPVGQYPNVEEKPDLPYETLRADQYLYDLVYNPALTAFLQEGRHRGCHFMGGMEMLIRQAERAWEIWSE